MDYLIKLKSSMYSLSIKERDSQKSINSTSFGAAIIESTRNKVKNTKAYAVI